MSSRVTLEWRPLDLKLTPDELAARWPIQTGFALLESTLPNARSWSVLTAFPSHICLDELPGWFPDVDRKNPPDPDSPPFATGWIGFLSYESAGQWNPLLTTRAPRPDLPGSWWGRYDAALAYRHADRTWSLGHLKDQRSEEAADRLLETVRRITSDAGSGSESGSESQSRAEPGPLARRPSGIGRGAVDVGTSEESYHNSIETILDWIGQGHIYQANFTYPVTATLEQSPFALYQRLRLTNPAPYGAFLQVSRELAILSSSPEQFLRIDGAGIQTKPIKGTEARHPDPEKDRALATSLLQSEKDRAELTMIVDLERNDLGRVCRFGSVTTHEFPIVESFRSVHHLVATVEGQLRENVGLREILAATFPGGSITGAPKIRAMEIIAELETRPRFIYTGALGYLDDRGTAELALTIRTLWTDGNQVHFDVGGGIVADSTAESEWEETHQKAEGMRRAIED